MFPWTALDKNLGQPNIDMSLQWIYSIYKSMASSRNTCKKREGGGAYEDEEDISGKLKCFENQPNINMVIPWIYEIYKSVKSGGGGSGGGSEEYDYEWEDLTEGD